MMIETWEKEQTHSTRPRVVARPPRGVTSWSLLDLEPLRLLSFSCFRLDSIQ
jgi:hypothetical protein